MKTLPIRYCTGGCSSGPHHAHAYDVDPVDGPLDREHLCPGNQGEVMEWLEDGERTGQGWTFNLPLEYDDETYRFAPPVTDDTGQVVALSVRNSGLGYARLRSGRWSLVDTSPNASHVRRILTIRHTFREIRADFFTEQTNRRA